MDHPLIVGPVFLGQVRRVEIEIVFAHQVRHGLDFREGRLECSQEAIVGINEYAGGVFIDDYQVLLLPEIGQYRQFGGGCAGCPNGQTRQGDAEQAEECTELILARITMNADHKTRDIDPAAESKVSKRGNELIAGRLAGS